MLVTHSDNDHYSVPTCSDLARVTSEYHSTQYVASLMEQQDLLAYGHDLGEHFAIGPVGVQVTPAESTKVAVQPVIALWPVQSSVLRQQRRYR